MCPNHTDILDELAEKPSNTLTLDQLEEGQTATIQDLATRGEERRRLMDLGFVPGAKVRVEMKNPLGDPRAYLIMSAVVALRRSQAREIAILLDEEKA